MCGSLKNMTLNSLIVLLLRGRVMSLPFESRWVCDCPNPQNAAKVILQASEAPCAKAMQCHLVLGMLTLGEASHPIKKPHCPETIMLERPHVGTWLTGS